MQFVLTRMYKSQDGLVRGGHESVDNWTIGSGHRVPLLSLTVSFLSCCLPCSDPSFPGEMHLVSCKSCVAFWGQGL